ncbi:ABC transporter permease, partial [Sinorhizobium medicae]
MANSESGQPLAVAPQAYGALWRGLLRPLRTVAQPAAAVALALACGAALLAFNGYDARAV